MYKKALGLVLLVALMLFLTSPVFVLADATGSGTSGGTSGPGAGGGTSTGGTAGYGGSITLTGMAQSVKNAAVAIATPIVVVGWIIAGILYLTAAGAPEKINTAKSAMIACVIGTVLVVLAIGSAAIVGVIQSAFGLPTT